MNKRIFSCLTISLLSLNICRAAAPTTNKVIVLSPFSLDTNQFDTTQLPLRLTNISSTIVAGLGTNDITTQILTVGTNLILYSNLVTQVITNTSLNTLSGNGGDDFNYRTEIVNFNRSASSGYGDNLSHVGTSASAIGAIATEPFGYDDTVTGSPTVAYWSGNVEHYNAHLKRAMFMCSANSASNRRIWVGLSDQGGTSFATVINSDAPATVKLVAFRHSTSIPDTNWKFVTQDGSSQTVTDTGIAFATSTAYTFEMRFSASAIVALINGAPVATNTTALPASSTLLYGQFGMQAISGSPTFRGIQWKILERYGF